MTDETKIPSSSQAILIAISKPKHSKDICDILLEEHKVANPIVVNNGEAAWAKLKEGGIDFVIMDWKLEKLSGLVIFNRLKQDERYEKTPILIVSELMQKENFVILKDYPLTALADGPLSPKAVSLKFDLLNKDTAWYLTHNDKLNAITVLMKTDSEKAKGQLMDLAKTAPNPIPILNLGAKKFREKGYMNVAEEILKDVLKRDKENLKAIMELAKVYHSTARHKDALELMKANKFSMKNVERLLFLGEINLADKNPGEARKIFTDALSIDAENETAKLGLTSADNMQKFLDNNESKEQLPASLASMLNLVAVSMAKSGQEDEAMQQYEAALAFVHDSLSQARIMYNVGLGYVRWSKKEEALKWFMKSAETGGPSFDKPAEQIKRLNNPTPPPGQKPAAPVAQKPGAPKQVAQKPAAPVAQKPAVVPPTKKSA